ncbi:MAG: hemin uptake protein HemP [Pseudomonadota bacterium]|nr:hemin uptake protein HemP [Pseudomonadota bacterium]
MSSSTATSAASGAGACPENPAAPVLDSADILRGQKTVEISHNGTTYRLQATRLGKLILTK